jgi:GNAT superfamily N-acetyltransferase
MRKMLTRSNLAQTALRVNSELLPLGHERFEVEGAMFVWNRAIPAVRDANHVTKVTVRTEAEIDALLHRVEIEFEGFPHRRFDLDFTMPPELEARLSYEGYTHYDSLVMVLEGDLKGQPKRHDIRPVELEADWRRLVELFRIANSEAEWDELNRTPLEDAIGEAKSKTSPVRWWLAFTGDEAAAHLCSWSGLDGVGQVEDLFTHADYRHRCLATALIHRCVTDAREGGAGPVVVVAIAGDTPKQMYADMGCRPVAVKSVYKRLLTTS